MDKIKLDTLQDKTLADGTTSKIVRLTPKNPKEMIKLEDIRAIYNSVRGKKEYASKRIFVQGLADRRRDLVKKSGIFISDEDYDEYLDGKVGDKAKFRNFFQCTIMIYGK
jgi:hypothetical protein